MATDEDNKFPTAEEASVGGKNTRQYVTVQRNFIKIITALEQNKVLFDVATEVFQKQYITSTQLEDCSRADPDKAKHFVIDMLRNIALDEQAFYVYMSGLERAGVSHLARKLRRIVGGTDQSATMDGSSTSLGIGDQEKTTIIGTNEVRDAHNDQVGSFPPVAKQDLPPSSTFSMPLTGIAHGSAHKKPEADTSSDIIEFEVHSKPLFMTPIERSETGKNSALVVNGASNTRNTIQEVKQELQQYQDRVHAVECDLKELRSRESSLASIKRNHSLDLDVARQRKSMEFHQKKLEEYAGRMEQLETDMVGMKDRVERVEDKVEENSKQIQHEVASIRKDSSQELESVKLDLKKQMEERMAELKEEIRQSNSEIPECGDSNSQLRECCSVT